uniref:Secreted protein n=1 Tax=Rhipicephalus appendiculatus TaxID=34631 RepID=A0A131YB87_RHIAP
MHALLHALSLFQCIAENKVAALLSGVDSIWLDHFRLCLQFYIVQCETEASHCTAKCLTVAPSARRCCDVSAGSFQMPLFSVMSIPITF